MKNCHQRIEWEQNTRTKMFKAVKLIPKITSITIKI